MLPKNNKHYIKPTADELGCDIELIEDVISFYYADVRKSLVDMRGPTIQIENLGTFKAKKTELPKLVAKYTKHLEVLNPETFNQVTLQKSIQSKLEKVMGLQKKMQEESAKKTKFFRNKYEQRNAKQNMEEPGGDS